jgi:hypothetical protein
MYNTKYSKKLMRSLVGIHWKNWDGLSVISIEFPTISKIISNLRIAIGLGNKCGKSSPQNL